MKLDRRVIDRILSYQDKEKAKEKANQFEEQFDSSDYPDELNVSGKYSISSGRPTFSKANDGILYFPVQHRRENPYWFVLDKDGEPIKKNEKFPDDVNDSYVGILDLPKKI